MNLSSLVPRPQFLPSFRAWNTLEGSRIAVTGHRGVLGSLLAHRLRDHAIHVDTYPGDVCDIAGITRWIDLTRPTAIFHLAAIVPLPKVEADPFAAMKVNATALVAIQEAVAKFIPDSWLFLGSTSHVYAATASLRGNCRRVSEKSAVEPLSLYGATKLAGERVLEPLARHSRTQLCIGRIFSYFHEQQPSSFLVPGLLSRINDADDGSVIEVRDADAIRDFLYADMVVDAMLLLCARRATTTVNIGSGQATSIGEIADRVRFFSRKNISLQYLPAANPGGLVANTSKLRKLISTGLTV
ncbi:NAD-dependent epimerase/dehydratase family protein [Rhodanobacter sp. UC4450_H17]